MNTPQYTLTLPLEDIEKAWRNVNGKMMRGLENEVDLRIKVEAMEAFSLQKKNE